MSANQLIWDIYLPHDPSRVSVLAGTIHLADERVKGILGRMLLIADDYSHVYTEAPLTSTENSYLNQNIFVDPQTWKQYWSLQRKEKIRKILLKTFKTDIDDHLTLRPMFITTLLYRKMLDSKKPIAMDQKIWDRAAAEGKVTGGLESIEEQVKVMQGLSLAHEYAHLWSLSKNVGKARKKYHQLIDLYCRGNISAMLKRTKGSLGPNKNVLLRQRNQTFASRIADYHRSAPCFFSLGAAHLAGNTGVLNLLKHHGFKRAINRSNEKN